MDLLFLLFGAILWSSVAISIVTGGSSDTKNKYRCGIRKHKIFSTNEKEPVKPGQWPWNAFVYYKEKPYCSGTLINQHHVLTLASCVTEWNKKDYAPLDSGRVSILMGVNKLYRYLHQIPNHGRITNVSQIIIHPEYTRGRHDIALLVLSKPIHYSEYVIPICIAGIQRNQDEDLSGQVGGMADVNLSLNSYTFLVLVENTTKCADHGPLQFGTFYASFQNSAVYYYMGAGLYNFIDNHWELRGIAGINPQILRYVNDTYYRSITNVTYYNEWIRKEAGFYHQISEIKCRQYKKLARKYSTGICINQFNEPHIVAVVDRSEHHIITGSIISENFVLAKIPNLLDSDFDWDDLWIEKPHTKITNIIFHPKYDPETLRYDVMLLELASPLTLSSDFIPICLANEVHQHLNKLIFHDDFHPGFSKIISNEQCKSLAKKYHQKFDIYSEDICVTLVESNDIVKSPLGSFNAGSCMFTQVGVFKGLKILLNEEWDEWNEILVFSRVTAYLDWIEQVVWGSNADFFED